MLIGTLIGFAFSWKISIAMFVCAPILAIGTMLEVKFSQGDLSDADEDLGKEALLL